MHLIRSEHRVELPWKTTFDEEGNVDKTSFSLVNPKVCSAILVNYSKLRENS
jgi:hypothetical protein